jgi:hypothetical protein
MLTSNCGGSKFGCPNLAMPDACELGNWRGSIDYAGQRMKYRRRCICGIRFMWYTIGTVGNLRAQASCSILMNSNSDAGVPARQLEIHNSFLELTF